MNILTKIGSWVKMRQKDIFLAICLCLIAFISYDLGRINALKKSPISISGGKAEVYEAAKKAVPGDRPELKVDKRVVASKNSDKYHFTWCSGAQRIKEENKVWFIDENAAKAAGYTRAGNCN